MGIKNKTKVIKIRSFSIVGFINDSKTLIIIELESNNKSIVSSLGIHDEDERVLIIFSPRPEELYWIKAGIQEIEEIKAAIIEPFNKSKETDFFNFKSSSEIPMPLSLTETLT